MLVVLVSIMLWTCFALIGTGKYGAQCREVLEENLFEEAEDCKMGFRFPFERYKRHEMTARATNKLFYFELKSLTSFY